MKPWHEFFPDNLKNMENSKSRIWVRFSHVPFLYWTVKDLCMLGLAVGKLIGMDNGTYRAATRNEPSSVARLLIETDVLDPVQYFILVDAYVVNRKSKVLLTYEVSSICGYCCEEHNGVCDLLKECFMEMGEEPTNFRLSLNNYGDSAYRDHVHSSDSDAESPRLENAEFDSELESGFLEDWTTSEEMAMDMDVDNDLGSQVGEAVYVQVDSHKRSHLQPASLLLGKDIEIMEITQGTAMGTDTATQGDTHSGHKRQMDRILLTDSGEDDGFVPDDEFADGRVGTYDI
ncbi:hypothetical protein POM88_045205 [Heracleum sosnowskyi]|uniref:DUF4283 domain-containing protein n=1 Tax=Heracleum sosnowskyi TaxID=360622 RepID=A0AAD8H6K2_9APIA|nr:hypothetical protein POM88_045205 [Heracleum sosnowskyi]